MAFCFSVYNKCEDTSNYCDDFDRIWRSTALAPPKLGAAVADHALLFRRPCITLYNSNVTLIAYHSELELDEACVRDGQNYYGAEL